MNFRAFQTPFRALNVEIAKNINYDFIGNAEERRRVPDEFFIIEKRNFRAHRVRSL